MHSLRDEAMPLHEQQVELDRTLNDMKRLQEVELKLLSIYKQERLLINRCANLSDDPKYISDIQTMLAFSNKMIDHFEERTTFYVRTRMKILHMSEKGIPEWARRLMPFSAPKAAKKKLN